MYFTYTTDHLILSVLQANSADKVLSFYERNRDYFEPWEPAREPGFYTLSYQRLSLTVEYNLILQSKLLRFWVFHQDNPEKIIGSVNFYNILRGAFSSCQLGYKLDKDYTGYGYASESIQKAMDILEKNYRMHRIEVNIMPKNDHSLRLINKLGFQYEGLAKSSIQINNKWEDHERYAFVFG